MNIIKKILVSCTLMYSCALLPSAPASASSSSCFSDESEKSVEQLTTREQIEYLFNPDGHSIEEAEIFYSNSIKVAAQCYDNNQPLKQFLDAQTKAQHAITEANKQVDAYNLFKKSSMSKAKLDAKAQEAQAAKSCSDRLKREQRLLTQNLPNETFQKYLEYCANSGLFRARLLTLKLAQQESQNYIQTQKLKAKNHKLAKQLQARDEEIALLRAQLPQSSLQNSPRVYQHRFAAQASMQPHQGPAQLSIPIEQPSDQTTPTIAHETGAVFFSPRTVEKALDAELQMLDRKANTTARIKSAKTAVSRFVDVAELVESPRDRAKLQSKKNAFMQKLRTHHSSKK